MSTVAAAVYFDLVDAADQPITNMLGTATLIGAQEPYITGNGNNIVTLVVNGSASTGAQANGPSAPTSATPRTTGGAMADGSYVYALTEDDGSESLLGSTSTAVIATSGANTGSVVLALPPIVNTNVVRRSLYRQKDSGGTYYRVAQLDDLTITTYIDTVVESSITSNPSPAGSAIQAGRMTFLLMAPADLADRQNGSAVISYSIVVGGITYYTNGTWAHSGTPINLTSILAPAPARGEVTQIWWRLVDPATGPQQGKITSFRISQDCFATDTGDAILALAPATNGPGGSDSTGYGTLFLKPNADTSIPGGFYYYQLDTAGQSQVFKVQVPLPDLGGHPDGFEISELSPVLVGNPGQLVINASGIQAVTTQVDHPFTSLSTTNTVEDELVNIRDILRVDKGLANTHWADARATLTTTGAASIGGDLTVTGNTNTTGYLSVVNSGGIGTTGQLFGLFLQPSGMTGTSGNVRFVGRHDSGAPTAGTFQIGDITYDGTAHALWACTANGTPGTWTQMTGAGSGGSSLIVATSVVDYAFTTEDVVLIDCSSASRTVTLPAPAIGGKPRWVIRVDTNGSTHATVAPHTSEHIAGLAASYVMPVVMQSVLFITNGAEWFIAGGTDAPITVTTVTTATTLTAATARNRIYRLDGTSVNVNLVLPAASGFSTDFPLTAIRIDSTGHTVQLVRSGSDLINGSTTFPLSGQWSSVIVSSNGSTAWDVIAQSGAGGSGTVTSVGLTVPSGFSVSGSPVTTAGTLAMTANNQSPNLLYAGPVSGGAAAPSFRAAVAADIPSLDAAKIASGTLAVARLPDATSSAHGIGQPDTTTLGVTGGVFSALFGPRSTPVGSQNGNTTPVGTESISLLDVLRNGTHSNDLWDLASVGIREFDLQYVSGTYYLFHYLSDSNCYVRSASTIAGLSSASDTLIIGGGVGLFPSALYDGTTWHLWTATGTNLQHATASTASGTYTVVDSFGTGFSDPQVRKSPNDGKFYCCYKETSSPFRAGTLVATSTSGPWTDLGFVFAGIGRASWYSYEQADPTPIFWNNRVYIAFAAASSASPPQRIALVEVDPTTMQAIAPAVCLVEPLETWHSANGLAKVFNPIWLALPGQPGQERLYYSHQPTSYATAGWGYVQVGSPAADGRRTLDLLRLQTTVGLDVATGIQATAHGGALWSVAGFSCSATPSGAYSNLNTTTLGDFTMAAEFSLIALPGSDGLLARMSPNAIGANEASIRVTSAGLLKGKVIGGTTLTLTGSTTLTTGVVYRALLRRINSEVSLYLGTNQEATGTQGDSLTGLTEWSLANNKGGSQTAGEQLRCTLYRVVLSAEALPLSADPFTGLHLGAGGGGGGGATTLAALTDVALSSPATGQALVYNGSAWANQAFATGSVVKHNGSSVGTEAAINLIDGLRTTLTVTDNPGAGRVDITIAGLGELLMQDGVTGPPIPLELEDRSDWIYEG